MNVEANTLNISSSHVQGKNSTFLSNLTMILSQLNHILQYLSLRFVFSNIIILSRQFNSHLKHPDNIQIIQQLLTQDFPLIFLLCTDLQSKLHAHSTENISIFIRNIYNNFKTTLQLSSICNIHETVRTSLLTESQKLDAELLNNLYSIIMCGGISSIQHYLQKISKIKKIPTHSLYFAPVTKYVKEENPDPAKGRLGTSIGTLNTVRDYFPNPYDRSGTTKMRTHWKATAMDMYLSLFDVTGSIRTKYPEIYVLKFREFILKHVVPDYAIIHGENRFAAILETELFNYSEDFTLLNSCFHAILNPNVSCKPIIRYKSTEYHECRVLESLIIRTITEIQNKQILKQCYEDLCDENSNLYQMVSMLNLHLIFCYQTWKHQDRGSKVGPVIIDNADCIEQTLAKQIFQRYAAILYKNFSYKAHPNNYIHCNFNSGKNVGKYTYFGVPMPVTMNQPAKFEWMHKIQLLKSKLNSSPITVCAAMEDWSSFYEVLLSGDFETIGVLLLAENVNEIGQYNEENVVVKLFCELLLLVSLSKHIGFQMHLAYLIIFREQIIAMLLNKCNDQALIQQLSHYYKNGSLKSLEWNLTNLKKQLHDIRSDFKMYPINLVENVSKANRHWIDYMYYMKGRLLLLQGHFVDAKNSFIIEVCNCRHLYIRVVAMQYLTLLCGCAEEYGLGLKLWKLARKLCHVEADLYIMSSVVKSTCCIYKRKKYFQKKVNKMKCGHYKCKANKCKLKCCSGCMKLMYCSKKCQRYDWSRGN
eukprot:510380_1